MGPRIGRFDSGGRPVSMPGHSVPLAALGAFILVFGFLASNGAKQGSISNPGDGARVTSAMVNTALGTSAAGISTLVFSKMFSCLRPRDGGAAAEGKYSFLTTMNGSLAGMKTESHRAEENFISFLLDYYVFPPIVQLHQFRPIYLSS